MALEKKSITKNPDNEQFLLKAKLKDLQIELNSIQQKTIAFETILRSHLENEIIEEQELTVLYKKLQKAKKEKRIAQKKRGKNFKEIECLKIVAQHTLENFTIEEQKVRKRLYREAMIYSHPDKFSLHHEKIDLATEITTRLIEIYKYGSLEKLQDFHNHICNGNAFLERIDFESVDSGGMKDRYLEKEILQIQMQLEQAKNRHTFKVLTEYENPLTFIQELKEYYLDRIFKLKKRTRKAS